MNMPEYVRETILDALSITAEYASIGGEEWAHLDEAIAWIDAQPVMPERWMPVGEGDAVMLPEHGETAQIIVSDQDTICFHDAETDPGFAVYLPPGYALCRLVEPGTEAAE